MLDHGSSGDVVFWATAFLCRYTITSCPSARSALPVPVMSAAMVARSSVGSFWTTGGDLHRLSSVIRAAFPVCRSSPAFKSPWSDRRGFHSSCPFVCWFCACCRRIRHSLRSAAFPSVGFPGSSARQAAVSSARRSAGWVSPLHPVCLQAPSPAPVTCLPHRGVPDTCCWVFSAAAPDPSTRLVCLSLPRP